MEQAIRQDEEDLRSNAAAATFVNRNCESLAHEGVQETDYGPLFKQMTALAETRSKIEKRYWTRKCALESIKDFLWADLEARVENFKITQGTKHYLVKSVDSGDHQGDRDNSSDDKCYIREETIPKGKIPMKSRDGHSQLETLTRVRTKIPDLVPTYTSGEADPIKFLDEFEEALNVVGEIDSRQEIFWFKSRVEVVEGIWDAQLSVCSSSLVDYQAAFLEYFWGRKLIIPVINEWLRKGYILRGETLYIHPLVVTPKSDSGARVCLDAGGLDAILEHCTNNPPKIEDLLFEENVDELYSTLDFQGGFL